MVVIVISRCKHHLYKTTTKSFSSPATSLVCTTKIYAAITARTQGFTINLEKSMLQPTQAMDSSTTVIQDKL